MANKFNELIDHYTKLCENETVMNPINSNYGPIMIAPHVEPSPSLLAGGGNRKSNGKCVIITVSENTHRHTCRYLHEKQVLELYQEG